MSNPPVLREVPALGKIAAVSRPPDAKPAIQRQLARMLASSVFIQSERLSRFLRFIVEHVLDGDESSLKEYVIGCEVYDRKPPYHPSQDSIVRTEARRLRNKLKEYYEGEGKEDSIYVFLRPGRYIPVFQDKETLAGTPSVKRSQEMVSIAIRPFLDISQHPLSARFARGVPDELAYILVSTAACRVVSPACIAQLAFEGTVRLEMNRLRITARIVDAAGVHLWVSRVDAEVDRDPVFHTEEQIACALSTAFKAFFVSPEGCIRELPDLARQIPFPISTLTIGQN